MSTQAGRQLEQYTVEHPQEVLLVKMEIEGELDEVAIFKGFSSSLTRSTAFDPDVPVIPDEAKIINIDRARAPYNPANPTYIERELTWESFQLLLPEREV